MDTFERFPNFPPETRAFIWEAALQADAFHLNVQIITDGRRIPVRSHIGSRRTWRPIYAPVDGRNHMVPQVSREARHIALRILKLRPICVCVRESVAMNKCWQMAQSTIFVNWETDLFHLPVWTTASVSEPSFGEAEERERTMFKKTESNWYRVPADMSARFPIRRVLFACSQLLCQDNSPSPKSMLFDLPAVQRLEEFYILRAELHAYEQGTDGFGQLSIHPEQDDAWRKSQIHWRYTYTIEFMQEKMRPTVQMCDLALHPLVRSIMLEDVLGR